MKPWPNGLASRRKLKNWVYVWPDLAWSFDDLCSLCLKFARKSTHVFYRLATQPRSTQLESPSLTSYQPMKHRVSALKWVFVTCVFLWGTSRVCLATHCRSVSLRSKCSRSKNFSAQSGWRKLEQEQIDSRSGCGKECSLRRLNASQLASPFGQAWKKILVF